MKITPAMRKVLRAIHEWTLSHSYPPAIRDLCTVTGYTSTKTVWHHLLSLVARGCIEVEPGLARTVRLTEAGREALMLDGGGGDGE
jgi:repressor LexA